MKLTRRSFFSTAAGAITAGITAALGWKRPAQAAALEFSNTPQELVDTPWNMDDVDAYLENDVHAKLEGDMFSYIVKVPKEMIADNPALARLYEQARHDASKALAKYTDREFMRHQI